MYEVAWQASDCNPQPHSIRETGVSFVSDAASTNDSGHRRIVVLPPRLGWSGQAAAPQKLALQGLALLQRLLAEPASAPASGTVSDTGGSRRGEAAVQRLALHTRSALAAAHSSCAPVVAPQGGGCAGAAAWGLARVTAVEAQDVAWTSCDASPFEPPQRMSASYQVLVLNEPSADAASIYTFALEQLFIRVHMYHVCGVARMQ